jgi:hypothetical protein
MDESVREHWHLKKEVTWGHLMTTLALVAAGFGAWNNVTNDISKAGHQYDLVKTEVNHVKELQQSKIEDLDRALKGFQAQFERVERKLDQLIVDRKLQQGMGAKGDGTMFYFPRPPSAEPHSTLTRKEG